MGFCVNVDAFVGRLIQDRKCKMQKNTVMISACLVILIILGLSSPCNAKDRQYYVAAVDIEWDYAPSGYNRINNISLNSDKDASVFTKKSSQRIGKVYRKTVYREYTDGSFTTQAPRDHTMGIMGPVLKGEAGDSIVILFKNLAKRNFTMHPHTVFYDKLSEGAVYSDHTGSKYKTDDGVSPGKTHTYVWIVTEEATPVDGDPRCLTWLYHSHILPTQDINSGPVGIIQTCKSGSLGSDGKRLDVDKEFYLLLFVFDENQSWYLDENLKSKVINHANINKNDEDFKESNLMHSINGRIYGNIDGFNVCQGDKVAWHISVLGSEPDMHTISFNGNTIISDHHRTDGRALFPSHSGSVTMQADNPGTWLISCQITDHLKAGMFSFYNVSSTCGKQINQNVKNGTIKEFYIAAEEVEWNYGPSGYNSFDGAWLNKTGSSSAVFFKQGPNRIGGKYLKAMYIEYTNSSFTVRKQRAPKEKHLGFLGPVIKAEVGSTIRVHFLNRLKFNASIHPRGVWYNKNNEGSLYDDNTAAGSKRGDSIPPNSSFIYEWSIPSAIGPTAKDTPCIAWLYSSGVDQIKDTYSGLFGPLITCKSGSLKADGIPKGYDSEKYLFTAVMDENESWFLERNMEKYCTASKCGGISKDDSDFKESNKMHQMNGYMYGDLGIELCKNERALWYGLSIGTEIDIHGIFFTGNNIETDGGNKDSVMLFPGISKTFSMTPDNIGTWGLSCAVNDHYNAGMKFLYKVNQCNQAATLTSSNAVRRYYIGIVEKEWDYAPNNRYETFDKDLESDSLAGPYTKRSETRIGKVYKKALYREFTDATFTKMKPITKEREHLGMLGPMIMAEEGDEIIIVLKNSASRNYSIQPHGMMYSKDNEGAKYHDGATKRGTAVAPGSTYTYRWFVPKRAAPGPNDGNCLNWAYYSAIDLVKDTNSGLVGPLITCRKGTLKNGERTDVNRDFAMLFTVIDENESWYLQENINKYALSPSKVDKNDEDFKESNKMNAINGYIYSNGPNRGSQYEMTVGDRVAWYLLGVGNEIDIHTVHFHANAFIHRTNSKHLDDVIDIFPGIYETIEMKAVNPGTWLLHCHVNKHKQGGMETRFTIKYKLEWGGDGKASGIMASFTLIACMLLMRYAIF